MNIFEQNEKLGLVGLIITLALILLLLRTAV